MKVVVTSGGAIIEGKKIFLIKRSPVSPVFPDHWTFPGGRTNPDDESLKVTAVREVKEETNLDFSVQKKLNFYESQYNDKWIISHVFIGTASGELKLLEEECIDSAWYTYEETKSLEMAFAYREVLDELHEKGII